MARVLTTGWRYANPIHHGHIARQALLDAVDGRPGPHRLVRGDADGWDRLAGDVASQLGWQIETHHANWETPCRNTCKPGHRRRRRDGTDYCPAAGNYRNQAMVGAGADVCVAAPGATGSGTRDCMRRAKAAGIPVMSWPIDVPYRVLSIQQAWLAMILYGWKPIENRTWQPAGGWRGTLLLHASAEHDDSSDSFCRMMGRRPPQHLITYGAILGVARLADICDAAVHHRGCDCGPWAIAEQYYWWLTDVHTFAEPVRTRGALGLWIPDGRLVAQIEPQMAATIGGGR